MTASTNAAPATTGARGDVFHASLSGRLRSWGAAHPQPLTSLAIFLGFLLIRLPFRSSFPANWDAVQMVLGVQEFDLQHHQPHPPGYIGYVALGRALTLLLHDPHTALTLIAVIAGAAAPAAFYLLARRFMLDRLALCATVAFGSSVLVWYYSEVALTYAVELALVLPFALFAHRAINDRRLADLLLATALIAALGAFRQTALVLMLPLWLWTLWSFAWRARLLALALFSGAVLVWLAPLLYLSGGPFAYLQASRELAEITGGDTSVLSLKLQGPAKNLAFVVAGLALGLNAAALALVFGARSIAMWLLRQKRDALFFALWGLPALAVYLLGHVGQVGYILILLPIPFIWLGVALARVSVSTARLRWPRMVAPARASVALTAILVCTNVLGFFALPWAVNRTVPATVHMDLRQFNLRANDQHWQQLTAEIQQYPSESAAVLTTIGGPRSSGSFRHLAYLLPEYHVYGFGRELDTGAFGPLFHAYDNRNNYSIEGMRNASHWLTLPEDTRFLIIPDQEIADRLKSALPQYTVGLEHGSPVTVFIVDPGTTLAFAVNGQVITVLGCTALGGPCGLPPARTG